MTMRFVHQKPRFERSGRAYASILKVALQIICQLGPLSALGITACVFAQKPPVPFDEICFAAIDQQTDTDSLPGWQAWLQEVAGQPGSMEPIDLPTGPGCRINGLLKFVPTWSEDTLLRLQLQPSQRFRLHLFHGTRGVTLQYDAPHRGWIAYTTTRQVNAPRPDRLTLAATDAGRTHRSEFGEPVPIAFHYRSGELVLTRGDLILLGAPLPGVPQDIYADGPAELQAVEQVPCAGMPTAVTTGDRQPIRPTSLNWHEQLGTGATFEVLDSGNVRLAARQAAAPGWVTTAIPHYGPRELIVRLEHVTPGTGLFLAPAENQEPRPIIHFLRSQRDGRTCVALSENAQEQERLWKPAADNVIPYVDDTVWVRIAFGAGNLRWWVSTDGQHWAEAEQPISPLPARCSHLGLYHTGGIEQCRIELSLIDVHPLAKLAAYAPPALCQRAVTFIDQLAFAPDLVIWQQSVANTCPKDIEPESWQRASAVVTLGAGCAPQLAADLLHQLLDDAATEQWPFATQLQLFDEVGLFADGRLLAARGPTLATRYFQLGNRAWRHEGAPAMGSIRKALMESSLDAREDIVWTVDGVIRDQLFDLVYREQWSALRHLCRVLNFFGLYRYDRLVVWADQLSSDHLQTQTLIVGRRVPALSWHPLLSEELNRDVFNHTAELQSLLSSGSWKEASRHISNTMTPLLHGVAPSPHDPSLLASSRTVLRTALQQHPELVAQLESDYGELLRLQIELAIRRRNAQEIAQLAEQFPGLSASRHAETWLADQLLARGQAAEALERYQQAASHTSSEIDDALRARMRIAAALAGRPIDLPVDTQVPLGDVTFSPAELDALTEELTEHRRIDHQASAAESQSLYYTKEVGTGNRIALPLAVGNDTDQEVLEGVDRLQVDWPGMQLAVVRTADRLLVHNRFELVALDGATGQSRWTSYPMGDKMMRSRDWPLIPMRPLVHDNRVYARHLNAEAPQLACWELDSGRLLWNREVDQQIPVSDPIAIDTSLAVLTLDQQRSVDSILHLQFIDPDTGRYSRTVPLLRVRDNWWLRSSCQILTTSNRLYVVLGGLSFCCDNEGDLQWIRSSQATPTEADRTWITQIHQPPLLAGNTLILAQVGVRAIEAVDPETGLLRWRTVMPHLQQVLGIAGDLLIVKSQFGLSALDIKAGTLRWEHTDTQLLLAAACNGNDRIVYTRCDTTADERGIVVVQFMRLDAQTGEVDDSFTPDQFTGSQPNIGPLVIGDDRTWAFFSAGALGGQREMVELLGGEEGR